MPLKGSCHCRATQFEVVAPPDQVTRCTCSFCSKRGPLWAYYKPESFKLTTSRDRVATYQWGSYTILHHHCDICGCGTYTESPVWVDGKAASDAKADRRECAPVRRLRSGDRAGRGPRRKDAVVARRAARPCASGA